MFEHRDIAPRVGLEQPMILSFRKNLFDSLLDMIGHGKEQPVLFPAKSVDPATGERIYREMHTGDRWLHLQVPTRRKNNLYLLYMLMSPIPLQQHFDRQHGRRLPILMLNLWSDGTSLDKAGRIKVQVVMGS